MSHSRRGWVAPVELSRGNQQAATHVLPLDQGRDLIPHYRLEFARCLAGGGYTPDRVVMDLQPSGFLKTLIDGWSLRFRLRVEAGQLVVFEYVGKLTHPDFAFPLAEIVPEHEDQLEALDSQRGIVLVGCDPVLRYGGLDAAGPPTSPRTSR